VALIVSLPEAIAGLAEIPAPDAAELAVLRDLRDARPAAGGAAS
jgi:hypothetical protein